MNRLREISLSTKHRVEHSDEWIAAELEKRYKQYQSDKKPSKGYRQWCKKEGIPVPDWAQEANRRFRKEVDVTPDGTPKSKIRSKTNDIRNALGVHNIKGYVSHHCCGYDHPEKFVYIPVKLHHEIHKRLRALKIDADSNHWNYIVDLINSCDKYTYTHI